MAVGNRAKVPASETKVSRFVRRQLPAAFSDVDSLLIPFVEAYYEWMEQEGGIDFDIKSLPDYQDFRKAPEEFMSYFVEEFLPGIPAEILADRRLLIRYAKDFYRSRGSEPSFKFLFRILFNEDVQIHYPKEDVFRSSDAKWVVRHIIKLNLTEEEAPLFIARKIRGYDSAATAIVEDITFTTVGSERIAICVISSRNGNFVVDEAVAPVVERHGDIETYARVIGSISRVDINSRGSGYVRGAFIPIADQGDGSGVVAVVDTIDINGGILKIRVIDGGIGYVDNPPTPDISLMSGSGAEFSFIISGSYDEPGYFVDDSCQPSSTKRLQDGKKYQEYSYVLRSKVPPERFRDIVKRLVHPAGMYMATELLPIEIEGEESDKILFHLTQPEGINSVDSKGNSLFIDFKILHERVPAWRTPSEIDSFYPDGIPSEVAYHRIVDPSSARVLSTLGESNSHIIVIDYIHFESHPFSYTTDELEYIYPDGIPSEVSYVRLYSPASLEVLTVGYETDVTVTT